MKNLIFLICLILFLKKCDSTAIRRSIVDNIQSGIKFAGKILGIDTAADVADLVSKAFSKNVLKNKNDEAPKSEIKKEQPNNLLGGLFRLMGLEGSKLGALAINGIIFIAQMIGKSLMSKNVESKNKNGKAEQRSLSPGSPLDWVLDNKNDYFTKLLANGQDKKLPEQIVEMVSNYETDENAECIKLLLCKTSPFIWGMQKAVSDRIDDEPDENRNKADRVSPLFKYIPDVDEFKMNADGCENRYTNCKIYD